MYSYLSDKDSVTNTPFGFAGVLLAGGCHRIGCLEGHKQPRRCTIQVCEWSVGKPDLGCIDDG
jgi:hypothetical protein